MYSMERGGVLAPHQQHPSASQDSGAGARGQQWRPEGLLQLLSAGAAKRWQTRWVELNTTEHDCDDNNHLHRSHSESSLLVYRQRPEAGPPTDGHGHAHGHGHAPAGALHELTISKTATVRSTVLTTPPPSEKRRWARGIGDSALFTFRGPESATTATIAH